MTGAEAAALGFWLPVLGRAVIGALGESVEGEGASWNVIQANGILLLSFLAVVRLMEWRLLREEWMREETVFGEEE